MSHRADGPAPHVLLVPGLRDHVPEHWQTLLQSTLPNCSSVTPLGRKNLSCDQRVEALEAAASRIVGPLILVAHSAGCITVAHWARRSSRSIMGALLATPPDFDLPLPSEYPTPLELSEGGWLPVPRDRLPFPSLAALSRNDPLGGFDRVLALVSAWGSQVADLGLVGHLNPGSGFGQWPQALTLIEQLIRGDGFESS